VAKRALFVCDLSGHQPKHVADLQKITFDFVAKMDVPDVKVRDLLAARVRRMVGM
jgi:hypothetical protein